jgi:hypothetical protein
MRYVLRFVQHYQPDQRAAYMNVEAKFAAMERRRPDFPQGRRLQPYAGREPSNTLVWECEFPSVAEVQAALAKISTDDEHEILFCEQIQYIREHYTEISEILEF